MSDVVIFFANGNKIQIQEEKLYLATGEHFGKMVNLVGLDKYAGKTFVNLDNVCMISEPKKQEDDDE